MDRRAPLGEDGPAWLLPGQRSGLSGRIPLAVVVADGEGLVSHWSSGAQRLFGYAKHEAQGRPAVDLLPVSGALGDQASAAAYGPGRDLDASLHGGTCYPTAGRARLFERGDRSKARLDVLWWAYPLVGPGPERLLVMAADAARLRTSPEDADGQEGCERITPGFVLHTEFPGADELARRLPEIMPGMSVAESHRIVSQVLELGYPVLEISRHDRVPVTPVMWPPVTCPVPGSAGSAATGSTPSSCPARGSRWWSAM